MKLNFRFKILKIFNIAPPLAITSSSKNTHLRFTPFRDIEAGNSMASRPQKCLYSNGRGGRSFQVLWSTVAGMAKFSLFVSCFSFNIHFRVNIFLSMLLMIIIIYFSHLRCTDALALYLLPTLVRNSAATLA